MDAPFFDLPTTPRITVLSWPTRVVLGPGALRRLPEEVRRLDLRRPLLVTDAGVVKAGLADRVIARPRRGGAGPRPLRSGDAQSRPSATSSPASRRTGPAACDGIIALGGGSPLDAAKLVQLLTSHAPPLSQYDDATGGDRFVTHPLPPLIAIPTTAGTGSEVSRSGVAFLQDTRRKTVIFAPALLPRAAICDPELTYGPAAAGHRRDRARRLHPLPRGLPEQRLPPARRRRGHRRHRPGGALAAGGDAGADAHPGPAGHDDRCDGGGDGVPEGAGQLRMRWRTRSRPSPDSTTGWPTRWCLPSVMEFNRGAARARLARVAVAMGEPSRRLGGGARRSGHRPRAARWWPRWGSRRSSRTPG